MDFTNFFGGQRENEARAPRSPAGQPVAEPPRQIPGRHGNGGQGYTVRDLDLGRQMDTDDYTVNVGSRQPENVSRFLAAVKDLGQLVAPAQQDIDALIEQAKKANTTREDQLREQNKAIKEENEMLKTEAANLQQTVRNMKQALLSQNNAKEQCEHWKNAFENEKIDGNARTEKIKDDRDRLARELNAQHKRVEDLTKQKQKLETNLDEVRTRMSRLMAIKLSDNNPDIADLSDTNRPTKLAEKYMELYDNQWTEAFEDLDAVYPADEPKCIGILLSLIRDIQGYCETASKDMSEKVHQAIALPKDKTPEEANKLLKDFRKGTAELCLPTIVKNYNQSGRAIRLTSYTFATKPNIVSFIRDAIGICWLMSVQDPPVVLDTETHTHAVFDNNTYKAYTQTGPEIEYIVWPALYLHKGGALLAKGVAQGRIKQETTSGRLTRSMRSQEATRAKSNDNMKKTLTTTRLVNPLTGTDVDQEVDQESQDVARGHGGSSSTPGQRGNQATPVGNQATEMPNPKLNAWGDLPATNTALFNNTQPTQETSVAQNPGAIVTGNGGTAGTPNPQQQQQQGQGLYHQYYQQYPQQQQHRQPQQGQHQHIRVPTQNELATFKYYKSFLYSEEYIRRTLGSDVYDACCRHFQGQPRQSDMSEKRLI